MGDEFFALVQAQDNIGIADIDREQHSLQSILYRNHVTSHNPLKVSPAVLQKQRSVPIDAPGGTDDDPVGHLNPDFLPSQLKPSLPAWRQGLKTLLFEFSIASVEVLNQSPQDVSRGTRLPPLN